jgi:hypothetical protein
MHFGANVPRDYFVAFFSFEVCPAVDFQASN